MTVELGQRDSSGELTNHLPVDSRTRTGASRTPRDPDRRASSWTIAAIVGELSSDCGPWAPAVMMRGGAPDGDGASDGVAADRDDWSSTASLAAASAAVPGVAHGFATATPRAT